MSSKSLSLLRSGEFRRLCVGDASSRFAHQSATFAFPLLTITLLHGSAFQVGMVSAAMSAPVVALAISAGRITRRLPALLAISNLIRALCLVFLGAVYATADIELVHLLVLATIIGSATVFYDVGCQNLIPRILAPISMVPGVALLQAILSVSQLIGPVLVGWLIQQAGPPGVILAIAGLFLSAAVSFGSLRSAEEPLPIEHGRIPVLEGLRFITRTPILRSMCVLAGLFNLQQQAYSTGLIVYLTRVVEVAESQLGMVIGAGSLGALGGALTLGQLSNRCHVGATITAGVVSAGVALLVATLTGASFGDHAQIAFAIGFLINGFAQGTFNVFIVSLRQTIPPPQYLPAVNAAYRLASYGTIPIGALVGGWLAGATGSVHALLVISASMALTSFFTVRPPLRVVRSVADTCRPQHDAERNIS